MTHHMTPIALAGLLGLAVSFPGLAFATDKKPIIIVMPDTKKSRQGHATERLRLLVLNRLANLGYVILDGAAPHKSAAKSGPVELHFNATLRHIQGTYTTRAAVGLTAILKDAVSKQYLGQFEAQAGTPFRITSNCIRSCEDGLFFHRARPLAINLVSRIDRRLKRLPRRNASVRAERATHSLTFRGIATGMLPQIEQYLRFFPGVSGIRRDRTTNDRVLYRYRQAGAPDDIERSLRKMLHHLQINARLKRVGDALIVTSMPDSRPVVHSRDW